MAPSPKPAIWQPNFRISQWGVISVQSHLETLSPILADMGVQFQEKTRHPAWECILSPRQQKKTPGVTETPWILSNLIQKISPSSNGMWMSSSTNVTSKAQLFWKHWHTHPRHYLPHPRFRSFLSCFAFIAFYFHTCSKHGRQHVFSLIELSLTVNFAICYVLIFELYRDLKRPSFSGKCTCTPVMSVEPIK